MFPYNGLPNRTLFGLAEKRLTVESGHRSTDDYPRVIQNFIAFELHSIFSRLHNFVDNNHVGEIEAHSSPLRLESAVQFSQLYRSTIQTAIQMMGNLDDFNDNVTTKAQIQATGDDLWSLSLVWGLLEAISIRPSHNLIVTDLLDWARSSFPTGDVLVLNAKNGAQVQFANVLEELVVTERPEKHGCYWNSIIRHVMCGEFESAAALLQFHSAYNTDEAFSRMEKILRSAHEATFSDRTTCDSFLQLQKRVRDLVAHGVFSGTNSTALRTGPLPQTSTFAYQTGTAASSTSTIPTTTPIFPTTVGSQPPSHSHHHLAVLCSLLIGDRGTFRTYFAHLRTVRWFEVLPAFLLFFHPGLSVDNLGKQAESLFSLINFSSAEQQVNGFDALDRSLISILNLDFLSALNLVCAFGQPHSSLWFSTHLVDLLHFHDPSFFSDQRRQSKIPPGIASMIKSTTTTPTFEIALDFRSHLLIDYAAALFFRPTDSLSTNSDGCPGDSGLWEIGVDYLLAVADQPIVVATSFPAINMQLRALLELLIGGLDWRGSNYKAHRLLTLCDKYGLNTARQDILRALTYKYIREREWSSALCWALQTDSVDLQSRVARRILLDVPPERIGRMRVFEALAEQFIASPELVLLYKFYLFKRYLSDGSLREAIRLLHELFVDNSSPLEFHSILFDEMIRMLGTVAQQQPIGLPTPDSELDNSVPINRDNSSLLSLDREAVMDMFRALSTFQARRKLATKTPTAIAESNGAGLATLRLNQTTMNNYCCYGSESASAVMVAVRVEEQVATLRPLLCAALASSSSSMPTALQNQPSSTTKNAQSVAPHLITADTSVRHEENCGFKNS